MIRYFASKGIKVVPSRGAGPDLLIDGKAVEVKGSKYDFDRMLRQLLDYAYKYSDVALALPFDGLTIMKAHQLTALNGLIKEARNILLKVYVVAPDPSGHNDVFYVREFEEPSAIWVMLAPSWHRLGLDLNNPDYTIGEAVENLIKYSPVNNLKVYVCYEYDRRKVSKVQI